MKWDMSKMLKKIIGKIHGKTKFCFRKTTRRQSRVRLVVLPSEELHQATKREMERRYITSLFVVCAEYSNYWARIYTFLHIFSHRKYHSRELSSKILSAFHSLKINVYLHYKRVRTIIGNLLFQNYDLTLGMSGHLPNASGDYKMKQSMEHYKQTIIDPLVLIIQLNTSLNFEYLSGYSHQDSSSAADSFSISIVYNKLQVRSNATIPTPVIPDPRVPLGDFTSEHSRRIFKSEPLEHKTFKVWFNMTSMQTSISWGTLEKEYCKLLNIYEFLFSLPLRSRSSFLTISLNRSTVTETWKQADCVISSR